ncbi:MAG: cell division protein FtsW, partial [Acidimicrobiia bacterium]
MTRNVEGLTIIAASVLAAFALSLVNFAQDRNIDAQIALTFLVFLIAFGGLHLAVRAFAPRATPLLIAP